MTRRRYSDASHAIPDLMYHVLNGDEVGSRNGKTLELLHQHIVLEKPWRREILTPLRRASLPAQIAETMWLLAGRDDVEWLSRYLPRAVDFSDDGKVWRGAYGKRLRSWRGEWDQLAHVIQLLKEDPETRRAVMMIYDPSIDSDPGKDIPCNDLIQFQQRGGYLHMHVFIRSNDLMWGWSGINAFEWSAVQEIVAGLLGFSVGELHFSIGSLHLYEQHWDRAQKISQEAVPMGLGNSPRFVLLKADLTLFDDLVRQWFSGEEKLRAGKDIPLAVNTFPEPMLRSWLQVIAWYWSRDTSYLRPLKDTPLYEAALASPRMDPVFQAMDTPEKAFKGRNAPGRVQEPLADLHAFVGAPTPEPPSGDPFIEFVVALHAEKSAVYGDSWKRRGEPGILGNIARKIDRLGVAGGGDTAADTVIDLLVYCVLYRLWLDDRTGDQDSLVAAKLRELSPSAVDDVPRQVEWLRMSFAYLESVEVRDGRWLSTLEAMIKVAATVAWQLWTAEQPVSEGQRIDDWKAGNATRSWNPDV